MTCSQQNSLISIMLCTKLCNVDYRFSTVYDCHRKLKFHLHVVCEWSLERYINSALLYFSCCFYILQFNGKKMVFLGIFDCFSPSSCAPTCSYNIKWRNVIVCEWCHYFICKHFSLLIIFFINIITYFC